MSVDYKLGKKTLPHYRTVGSYNSAPYNERSLEVSLGIDFLNTFGEQECLEVGAVMPYYGYTNHSVVDAHDSYGGCIKEDALFYDYSNKNVLCLSTVEHMGNPANIAHYRTSSSTDTDQRPDSGLIFLKKVIKESSTYLITAPVGYYLFFDELLQKNNLVDDAIIMKRDAQNVWSVDPQKDLSNYYAKTFNNSNSVYIITNIPDYHD